ncbi:hypothetical protein C8Q78DRAFT_1081766 [Trametes maxima]|nr:hypothetical protein C8Q78DRAFT_1081766 [Trametes maxima]
MVPKNATTAPDTSQGPAPAIPTLGNTLGAFLVGTYLGLILYGMIIYQAYNYFRMYPDDLRLVKIWVIVILLVETVHTVMCWHSCYYYLVSNYFRPDILQYSVWSMNMLPLIASTGIGVSQGFFARRVYLINPKYRILVAISILLTVVAFGLSAAATSMGFILNVYTKFSRVEWLDSAALAAALLADSLTTAVLIIALKRSRTGIKRICNVVALGFSVAQPDNMIIFGVSIVATKVYGNSLLAVLNTRRDLAETCNSGTAPQVAPPPISLNRMGTASRRTGAAGLWNAPQVSIISGQQPHHRAPRG